MPTLMKNLDVSGINGVPIDQIRDLCDSLGGVDNPEVINVVGETLENISYSNTDESVLIKNENEGNDRKNLGTEESKKEISEAAVIRKLKKTLKTNWTNRQRSKIRRKLEKRQVNPVQSRKMSKVNLTLKIRNRMWMEQKLITMYLLKNLN